MKVHFTMYVFIQSLVHHTFCSSISTCKRLSLKVLTMELSSKPLSLSLLSGTWLTTVCTPLQEDTFLLWLLSFQPAGNATAVSSLQHYYRDPACSQHAATVSRHGRLISARVMWNTENEGRGLCTRVVLYLIGSYFKASV